MLENRDKYIDKKCVRCSINNVYLNVQYPSFCLPCKNAVARDLYANRKNIDNKFTNAKRNYKINKEEFLKLVSLKKCGICDIRITENKINIDHCHNTGKIRGILCSSCNKGLGMFKDNTKLLNKAIEYLKNSKE